MRLGFRELIALWKNGAPIKLGDIATVIDSVENTHQAGFINNKPAVVIAVQRQPDANTIEVVDQVRALLPIFQRHATGFNQYQANVRPLGFHQELG